jgi:methyl-accepting chemotaxis protein
MKLDLKKKIMVGSFILLVLVMAISTIVVSNIVSKQNRKASNDQLKKSFNIIVDDIMKKRKKVLSDSIQMGTLNNMSGKLKFLVDNATMGFSMLRDSYEKMALNIYNTGQTSEITLAGVYDMDNNLVTYFIKDGEAQRIGYIHQNKAVKEATLDAGQNLEREMWKETKRPSELSSKFKGTIPKEKILGFEIVDDTLSIVSYIPMIADSYNQETEEMEPTQYGILVAVQPLSVSFVESLSKLVDAKVNIFAGEKFISGVYKEYDKFSTQTLAGVSEGKSLEEQHILLNEVIVNDQDFFQGILPIFHQSKHIATITTLLSKEISRANAWEMIRQLIIVAVICIILFIPIIYVLTGKVVNPIKKVANGLKDVAEGEGDLTKRLQVTSADEVGDLAKWFNIFMERLQGMIKDIAENADHLNENSAAFSDIANQMSLNAEQMSSKSNTVAGSTEEMSGNMDSVAAAMEEASTNINMVASAAEQMTSTINEIAQNSEKARSVTRDAVDSAKSTTERVGELGIAAKEIGKVTEAITEISEQTNLLALNATIEAARAGEAGKGFAVVANEIKELAKQTADATQEIKEKIDGIQRSTDATVDEIGQIFTIINGVNEIVSSIATAVEEQSLTTKEIAGNVAQASQGINQVNQNVAQSSSVASEINREMASLNQVASDMSNSGTQVNLSSSELSSLSKKLKDLVNQFKV